MGISWTFSFHYYTITVLLSWRQLWKSTKLIPLNNSGSFFHYQLYSRSLCARNWDRRDFLLFYPPVRLLTLPLTFPGWQPGKTISRTPSCYRVLAFFIASWWFSLLYFCLSLNFHKVIFFYLCVCCLNLNRMTMLVLLRQPVRIRLSCFNVFHRAYGYFSISFHCMTILLSPCVPWTGILKWPIRPLQLSY